MISFITMIMKLNEERSVNRVYSSYFFGYALLTRKNLETARRDGITECTTRYALGAIS